ncbi:MAG: hypothetical protein U1C46_02725 [Bacteroidales bacterium]|nr:hypothetical protein [Bacteroidales bacterium]
MPSTSKEFQQLSQRIVINLARQMELEQQNQVLENKTRELELRSDHLTKEIKILTEENTDLKEIVYELHRENQQLRKLADANKPDEPEVVE